LDVQPVWSSVLDQCLLDLLVELKLVILLLLPILLCPLEVVSGHHVVVEGQDGELLEQVADAGDELRGVKHLCD
jgi:hypothetical protein